VAGLIARLRMILDLSEDTRHAFERPLSLEDPDRAP
jgi:hypothetical protein